MAVVARIAGSYSTADYRRTARRLRRLHAGQPARLQCALSELAHRHDANCPQEGGRRAQSRSLEGSPPASRVRVRRFLTAELPPASPGEHPGVEPFTLLVAQSLEGSILRYSSRVALLGHAQRLGLGRFQANLIIASIQHRSDSETRLPQPPFRIPLASVALAALAVAMQVLILVGAWIVLHT